MAGTSLLPVREAHAYLDPGSGSMLLQVLLGGVAAVGVVAKLYWHRIRGIFGSKERDEEEDGETPSTVRPERSEAKSKDANQC